MTDRIWLLLVAIPCPLANQDRIKSVIPTSTAKKFAELEQQIMEQQFIINRQKTIIRSLETELEKSMSERLKCLKCRVKLRELRRTDGS